LIAEGYTNRQIADQLVISLSTVQSHYGHIVGKLGLANRSELIRFAIRHGLVDLDD
jgi:DNA-binding NarL/FixJ family response regulator